MNRSKNQRIWKNSYLEYSGFDIYQSDLRQKAYSDILNSKSGKLGVNISQCPDCGHLEFHNNSCCNHMRSIGRTYDISRYRVLPIKYFLKASERRSVKLYRKLLNHAVNKN